MSDSGRVSDEAEAEIRDLAFALLDRCRREVAAKPEAATAQPGALQSATVSMAVQSVVFADGQTMAKRGEDFAELDPKTAGAIYRGLGFAVGHCLGAAGNENSALGLLDAYMAGMLQTMEIRAAQSRADFLKSKLGPKP